MQLSKIQIESIKSPDVLSDTAIADGIADGTLKKSPRGWWLLLPRETHNQDEW